MMDILLKPSRFRAGGTLLKVLLFCSVSVLPLLPVALNRGSGICLRVNLPPPWERPLN